MKEQVKIKFSGVIRSVQPRAVPYKDCPSSYDEGWLDEYCTEGRGDNEEELYRNVEMLPIK